MGERLVVVIEYDADPNSNTGQPLAEVMDQLRLSELTEQPHVKMVQVHAAIKDDAARVMAVFHS